MIKIYKYEFVVVDEFSIEMPKDAKILTVQIQQETSCIWALVNIDNVQQKRYFEIKGTGWEIKDVEKLNYIGTFQQASGLFIWHLFERIK